MRVTRTERVAVVLPGSGEEDGVHLFDVLVSLLGDVDPVTGMVSNLADMKRIIRREIVGQLHGRVLDGERETPRLPTPGALARHVWDRLDGAFGTAKLCRVRLAGHPSPVIDVGGGEETTMDVTRIYEFSASHRLHAAGLSDEENLRVFGKCNNSSGHGHNYVLEVTLRTGPGERGEPLPADTFDRIVEERVVDRWDHRHLNVDLPEFAGLNPTAEEIARLAWNRLEAPLAEAAGGRARLHRVTLRETARNLVEYYGEEVA
jgi:6-pyruvoyltetrahydropterin/6-carboxytetrahydropterin synthase